MDKHISLLDCTLRDGGYINNWAFGNNNIRGICSNLVKSHIDVVEVGFLRDCDYDPNVTLFNTLEEVERILPENRDNTRFVAMALNGTYDIDKLVDYDGKTVDSIRTAFHPYDIDEGLEFCRIVLSKGYKSYCQPINLMSYNDYEVLSILERVNKVKPNIFAIVDTFGSMMKEDLLRLYALVNHNLAPDIGLGIHLHENFGLAFSMAQEFLTVATTSKRLINIDASLSGMGRVPGNLCLELMAEYLNRYYEGNYDLDPMLDAIEDNVIDFKNVEAWGYSPSYLLSAKYGLHRNYAEHLVKLGSLKTRDIGHILGRVPEEKKAVFDKKFIDQLVFDYQSNAVDDTQTLNVLAEHIQKRPVLILAPGKSLSSSEHLVKDFVAQRNPVVICANFDDIHLPHDYTFYSNTKRYSDELNTHSKVIITSNLLRENRGYDYVMNFNKLAQNEPRGDSSVILILRMLVRIGCKQVYFAGFDGFCQGDNYCTNEISERNTHDSNTNKHMMMRLKNISHIMKLNFITKSQYEDYNNV